MNVVSHIDMRHSFIQLLQQLILQNTTCYAHRSFNVNSLAGNQTAFVLLDLTKSPEITA